MSEDKYLAKKKEYHVKGREVAEALLGALNNMSYDKDVMDGFISQVASSHRTIQQSSAKLVFALIEKWAKMGEERNFDLRNEATVQMSQKCVDAGVSSNLPFI